MDSTGNLYVISQFQNTANFGTAQLTSAGGWDIAVSKFDSSGALLWIHSAGGAGTDFCYGLAVDASGSCYVTGYFTGTASFGITNVTSAGPYDIFITKYDSAGNFVWVRTVEGGPSGSAGNGVAIDSAQNVYVTGFFGQIANFGTTNVTTVGAGYFLAKYNSAGAFQWVQATGGTQGGYTGGTAVAVSADGEIYATGVFSGPVAFGPFNFTSRGGHFFVVKYNAMGAVQWARSDGGYESSTTGIAVDLVGNCYVTGASFGGVSIGTIFLQGANVDGFLAKYNNDGIIQWATLLGGAGGDECTALALDSAGNCYLTGAFETNATFGATNITGSSRDAFLAKFAATGGLQWVQRAGGAGIDHGFGIAVDTLGNTFITGDFNATATFGGSTVSSAGQEDIFIAKRPRRPPFIVTQPQSRTVIAGTPVSLSVSVNSASPVTFQWQKDGADLPTKRSATLTISSAQAADAGLYRVIVSSSEGSVTSSTAGLIVRFSLTAVSSGNGTVSREPDQPNYAPDEIVTLTPLPAPGYTFNFWSGSDAGTANPLRVVMTANKNITAHFASTAVALSTQGEGSVSKSPNQPFYNVGDSVTLSATPGRWHAFTRWGDGPTVNPRVITIGTNNNYTAIFSPTTAVETLTFSNVTRIAPVGMPVILVDGEFVVTGTVARFDSARIEILTTFPNGSVLYTLDGSEPSLLSSLYLDPFTVRRTLTIRAAAWDASFANSWEADPVQIIIAPVYSLNVTALGGGTISVSPTNTSYLSNAMVTLVARPAPGWAFLQWLGDASGPKATNIIAMTRDKCVEAVFGTMLSLAPSGGGSVVAQPSAPLYPYGTTVRLTAVPPAGNSFALWGNAGTGTNNSLNFVVTNANPTVSVAFAPLSAGQYAMTAIADGFGVVTVSPRANRFASGASVTLTATAGAGQQFLSWTGDASGTQNPLLVLMNSSKVITAQFTRRPTLAVPPCSEPSPEDGFQFLVTGEFGAWYQLEKNDDWSGWSPLAMVTNSFGVSQFIDASATNQERRIYRALVP